MHTRTKILAAIMLLWFATPCLSSAQEKSELVQRIEQLSRLAKTVSSGTEYSRIITECDALLAEDLEKDSHADYLKSLQSWAFDKRAGTRVELASQFRKAGSPEQAVRVMEQAFADFTRSIEQNNNRWQTRMHRGTVYSQQKNYAEAIEDFTAVIEMRPEATNARFNRAELRFQLKEYQVAHDDYDHILKDDPADVQSLSGRAHCRLALEEYVDALQDYDAVVDASPNDGWALANRSDAHIAMRHWQKAREDLARATELQTNGDFCRKLAWLLATCPEESICDGSQSLLMAKRAIEITGESVKNLDTLAAAYAAAGEFDRARDVHSRVIALRENNDPSSAVKQAAYENNERYQEKFDQ